MEFWKITPNQKETIQKMGFIVFVSGGIFFITRSTAKKIGMRDSIRKINCKEMEIS